MKFYTSKIFRFNRDSKKKIKCNEGGARSTKTYSILQLLIRYAIEEKDLPSSITTVIRKSFNSLRDTAMRDFFSILKEYEWYSEGSHNKSTNEYTIGSTLFEFRGLDQPQKKRGAKRKRLFVNEANEITLEDWRQLTMRTTGEIFLDYNPSEEFSWIYDKVITRNDCELIHSTYKDNSFLEIEIVNELERLELEDDNYWQIYGLGLRGVTQERIYHNWKVFKDLPNKIDETIYGLDFGWNHPTALIRTDFCDNVPYMTELLYESHLKTPDIIDRLKDLKIKSSDYIYGDSQEPAKIQEILEAGFNIYPSDKSVSDGIEFCQRSKMYVKGANLEKEIKCYKWKVNKDGIILKDEPVKFNDHLCDAFRYARYTHTQKHTPGIVSIN